MIRLPVEWQLGPVPIPPHLVFDVLATVLALQVYRASRRQDPVAPTTRTSILVAAAVGAVIGSRLLAWLIDPATAWQQRADPLALWASSTVVGGLLGGHLAVEWQKRRMDLTQRTGDRFAIPMAVAIIVGRIGCFLSGLPDRTYGDATALAWGVDFGDGVLRHPTQIYEQLFLLALVLVLLRIARHEPPEGTLWRTFLGGYMAWRFLVGFIQPAPTWFGLSTIQWAALATLAFFFARPISMRTRSRAPDVRP